MKNALWCTAILLLLSARVPAQAQSKKNSKKQTGPSKHIVTNKSAGSPISNLTKKQTLNTTADYAAKANTPTLSSLKNTYTVTDPILTTLNARANGANIPFNKSGIVGMPKRAYGFANGHITLSTTGAVTSGTQTGSGSVGTGTSLATFGSIGAPMNVNGKSPYAGINMWGNAMNLNIIKLDSSARLAPVKNH